MGGPVAMPLDRPGTARDDDPIVELIPLVRRVVAARVRDYQLVDDLVQETLARVMAARHRIEQDSLAPYAVTTARNLVISVGEGSDRARRNAHLLVQDPFEPPPDGHLLRDEECSVVAVALARLSPAERAILLAHEVEGAATAELAASRDSSPGAIAAQLNRTRAKLRVEYLLAEGAVVPAGDSCRPVLNALSVGDRRRQRELDTAGHLLECDCCLSLSMKLFSRRPAGVVDGEVRVRVSVDADVVAARQQGRELAAGVGFGSTELTVIATAISEIARNIVRFAQRGEIIIRSVDEPERRGVLAVARDAGPGITDLRDAMRDGFSTDRGLGLGLPGARRLMDEFDITSEPGKGTVVTMTKWCNRISAAETN